MQKVMCNIGPKRKSSNGKQPGPTLRPFIGGGGGGPLLPAAAGGGGGRFLAKPGGGGGPLLFVCFGTPYEVAFLKGGNVGLLFMFNRLLDLIFLTDMLLQFFLSYPVTTRSGGELGEGRGGLGGALGVDRDGRDDAQRCALVGHARTVVPPGWRTVGR